MKQILFDKGVEKIGCFGNKNSGLNKKKPA
jgi:hypothetical protein